MLIHAHDTLFRTFSHKIMLLQLDFLQSLTFFFLYVQKNQPEFLPTSCGLQMS